MKSFRKVDWSKRNHPAVVYVLAPYPLLKFWPLIGKDHMQTLKISLFSSWLKSQSKWSNHSRIRVTTLNSFNNVCAPLSSVPENIQHEISSPSQMSPLSSKRWLNLGDLDKKINELIFAPHLVISCFFLFPASAQAWPQRYLRCWE